MQKYSYEVILFHGSSSGYHPKYKEYMVFKNVAEIIMDMEDQGWELFQVGCSHGQNEKMMFRKPR